MKAICFYFVTQYLLVESNVVVNTWPFTAATSAAYRVLMAAEDDVSTSTVLEAVIAGCSRCEIDQCDFSVGYGASPDTNGETTLDAMIMDGKDFRVGAVAQLRRVKDAIKVAYAVMQHSSHSILAGDGATEFATEMGFRQESLTTPYSRQLFLSWIANLCQPNYYRNVHDISTSCPPYRPQRPTMECMQADGYTSVTNHDTIGMVVLDSHGHMAAGVSSNGLNHKIAGRVGDAAIPGAGAYVDNTIGGAAATGDGDIMLRFLPSFQAVQHMANGASPKEACRQALLSIAKVHPFFKGGLVCVNRMGEYAGIGHGWNFTFSVQTANMEKPQIIVAYDIRLKEESARKASVLE